jgi:hypothetical protein
MDWRIEESWMIPGWSKVLFSPAGVQTSFGTHSAAFY